jgi:hypothetical protein
MQPLVGHPVKDLSELQQDSGRALSRGVAELDAMTSNLRLKADYDTNGFTVTPYKGLSFANRNKAADSAHFPDNTKSCIAVAWLPFLIF